MCVNVYINIYIYISSRLRAVPAYFLPNGQGRACPLVAHYDWIRSGAKPWPRSSVDRTSVVSVAIRGQAATLVAPWAARRESNFIVDSGLDTPTSGTA